MTINVPRKNGSTFRIPDKNLSKSGNYIPICAWCGKIRVGDDWLGLGEAVGKLELFDLSALPGLTHGMCRSCKVELRKKVGESRANTPKRYGQDHAETLGLCGDYGSLQG